MSENNHQEKPVSGPTDQGRSAQRSFSNQKSSKRGYQGKKPNMKKGSQQGVRAFGKPAYGKPSFSKASAPDGERKTYARPTAQDPAGERSFSNPAYGKPAFNKSSSADGERKNYARPAGQNGEHTYNKPAYVKPAFNKSPSVDLEKETHGRAAGQGQGTERTYSKPAYDKPAFNKAPSSEGERKIYGRFAGQSSERSFSKPSYGKPAFNKSPSVDGERKTYARPAGQGQSSEHTYNKPSYDKPAFNKSPSADGDRKNYVRPAGQGQSGERTYSKPAYGKPVFNKAPTPEGERKTYGRPAVQSQGQSSENTFVKPACGRPAFPQTPSIEGEHKLYERPEGETQSVERTFRKPSSTYGKPAFDRASSPNSEHKPYGRPAGGNQSGERIFSKPSSTYGKPAFDRASSPNSEHKPYGRPAGQSQSGERIFGKPAYQSAAPQGEHKPFGRPAPQSQPGDNRMGRPSFNRSAPADSFGRDTYGRPGQPIQNQQHFGRPAKSVSGSSEPSFNRFSPSSSSYNRPGAPRPSFNRSSPTRSDFRSKKPFQANSSSGGSLSADARKSAMLVLNRVLLESGYASLSLDEHFEKVNLSQRDKRLCTRIVYVTLENLNRIDFVLDRLLEDPERLEKRVRNILRLSAAQILLLDRVPDSAAVNEAVKLVRELGLEDLTGLVNGVLRNLIRGMDEITYPTKEDGLNYYHIMHSLPLWYIEKILDQYGPQEGDKLLSYRKPEHHMTIRFNPMRISLENFEELLTKKTWKAQKGRVSGAYYVTGVSDISSDIDYVDGLFSIQGEGSMMAALAVQPKLGSQVLDTCAAPGGKSAFLAEMLQGTGRVQAWDIYEHRVELIKAMAERLRHYNIRPAMRDALVYREQLEGLMDAVLIDAPCTGTGVMEEKPDLRHNLNEESLEELIKTQGRLLETCSRYVRSGGTLVYATCSVLREENSLQVEAFLSSHPEFSLCTLPESIPEIFTAQSGEFGLQLLPYRDGVEGFYIARMKRQ